MARHPATVQKARRPHGATLAASRLPPHPATLTKPRNAVVQGYGVAQRMQALAAPGAPARRTKTSGTVTFEYEFDPQLVVNVASVVPNEGLAHFRPGALRLASHTARLHCYPDQAGKGWRFGYIHTLLKSYRIVTYEDSKVRQKVRYDTPRPVRDSPTDDTFWNGVSGATAAAFVKDWAVQAHSLVVPPFEDCPFLKVPIVNEGRPLAKVVGVDNFTLWFVAQCQQTNTLVLLESFDWHATFIYVSQGQQFVRAGPCGVADGLDDCVSISRPVLDGTIANQAYLLRTFEPVPK